MSVRDMIMERTWAYRAWQAPFAARKFAPVIRHNDLARVHRVLDVGCGPGTNASLFTASDYVGVDINPAYIRDARRRHRREFIVADAGELEGRLSGTFDFVLVNSFLHHLDDRHTVRALQGIIPLVAPRGAVHVLELCRPYSHGTARFLAYADRGRYARPLETWRQMFASMFDPTIVEPYTLGLLGITLWEMVYLRGSPRTLGAAPDRVSADPGRTPAAGS